MTEAQLLSPVRGHRLRVKGDFFTVAGEPAFSNLTRTATVAFVEVNGKKFKVEVVPSGFVKQHVFFRVGGLNGVFVIQHNSGAEWLLAGAVLALAIGWGSRR